jgi:hypothetical protein
MINKDVLKKAIDNMPKEISPMMTVAIPMITYKAYLEEHPEERKRLKKSLQMLKEIEED